MNKKAMLLASSLLLGLPAANAAALTSSDFTDLKELDAATKAKYDALIESGIFDGMTDGTFGFNEKMDRAQFAKVAALIMGLEVDKDLKTSSFKDVTTDSSGGYALPYIEALKQAGITEGVGDGNFNPGGTVTKEQLATFLVRVLGQEANASSPTLQDPTVSPWAKQYVATALQLKLLSSGADGQFSGQTQATRNLLVLGSYETKKQIESSSPVKVSGADFASDNRLVIAMTAGIDGSTIDLSKITINGVPLDPNRDKFVLSDDKKTITIILGSGFTLDSSKTPVIEVDGVKSLFGTDVKGGGGEAPIPVSVTVPPPAPQPPSNSSSTPIPAPKVTIDDAHGEIGTESARYGISSSRSGTLYYALYPAGTAKPSAAEIKEGKGAVKFGSTEIGSNPKTLDLAGLTADTGYVLYAYAVATSRQSDIVSVSFKTQAVAVPAPVVTIDTNGVEIGTTAAQYNVSSTRSGTLYYAAYPAEAAAPSADAIRSGTGAIAAGSTEIGPNPKAIHLQGLAANTGYKLYVFSVASDMTSEIVSVSFSTKPVEVPAPVATIDTSSGEIGTTWARYKAASTQSGTLYYAVYPKEASAPSADTIRSGTGAVTAGSTEIGPNPKAIELSDLTASTAYTLYVFASASAAQSEIVSVSFSTKPVEVPAPVATIDTSSEEIGTIAAHYKVSSTQSGTLYYALYRPGTAIPSAEDIRGGANAEQFGSTEIGPNPKTLDLTGLSANTGYTLYVFATASDKQSAVVSVSFTTKPAEASAPIVTIDTSSGEISTITAHYSVKSTKPGTLYYALYGPGAAEPSLDDIRNGIEAVRYDNKPIGTEADAIDLFDLSPNTEYKLYAVVTAADKTSEIDSVTFSTKPLEVQVPVATIDTSSGEIGTTAAHYKVSSTQSGTLYYAVYGPGTSIPNADDIRGGANAVRFGSTEIGPNPKTLDLTGLLASTGYTLYVFATASDKQSEIVSVTFHTLSDSTELPPTVRVEQSGTFRFPNAGQGDQLTVVTRTDGADTVYYMLLNADAPAPSKEQIVSQNVDGVEGFKALGKKDVDPNPFIPTTLTIDQLFQNQSYKVYIVGVSGERTSEVQEYLSLPTEFQGDFPFDGVNVDVDGRTATVNLEGLPEGESQAYYLLHGGEPLNVVRAEAILNFPHGRKDVSSEQPSFTIEEELQPGAYYLYVVIQKGTSYTNYKQAEFSVE
ncbi:S-layer homology domain-containing protein [Cohnella xylanilytica]|uniref:S-layer homology domain-containing protein n=1 Tax=Cohnella xylanilytica TaxID=557555 RepID=A0A841TUH6_9BACL|nr:S-layer homology domain-containing protein [Cohnella xylanilytica]MBB6691329.1 S-layer homology domain-containing protein [Cohnella xylanilytica]